MKKIMFAVILFILFGGMATAGGLDGFLGNLNTQAQRDMDTFSTKLSTQFGIPLPQVQVTIKAVDNPADAFMCFLLGLMTGKPTERVIQTYQTNRGKGWGVIAKSLGIKPGSSEFHALKRGDFVFSGNPNDNYVSKGKGKGKGKNK